MQLQNTNVVQKSLIPSVVLESGNELPARYPVTLAQQAVTLFQIKEVSLLPTLELKCELNALQFWMSKPVLFNSPITAWTRWLFVVSATWKSVRFLKHTLIRLLRKLLPRVCLSEHTHTMFYIYINSNCVLCCDFHSFVHSICQCY